MNNLFRLILASVLTILTTCSVSTRTTDAPDALDLPDPPSSSFPPSPSPTLPLTPSVTITQPRALPAETAPPTPALTSTPIPTTTTTPITGTATVSTSVSALPLPLLFLTREGQVARLETDGTGDPTVRTITNEPGQVGEFAVSPTTGALACLVEPAAPGEPTAPTAPGAGEAGGEWLLVYVAADGQQRREVFRGPLSSPLFLADDESIRELDPNSTGQRIAYRVGAPLPDVPPERAGPGVFESYDIGMCPYLMQPDNDASPGGSQYRPEALSPDGTRLLLHAMGPGRAGKPGGMEGIPGGGTLAIFQPDGSLTPLHPAQSPTQPLPFRSPGSAAWSRDSSAVYVAVGWDEPGKAPDAAVPTGLWRADASTGAADLVFDGSIDGVPMQVAYPHPLPDKQVSLFLAPTEPPPHPSEESSPRSRSFTMYRMAADGSGEPVVVRSDHHRIRQVLWAPGGRGAVVEAEVEAEGGTPGERPASRLLWLSTDGGPAVELLSPGYTPGGAIRWGAPSP